MESERGGFTPIPLRSESQRCKLTKCAFSPRDGSWSRALRALCLFCPKRRRRLGRVLSRPAQLITNSVQARGFWTGLKVWAVAASLPFQENPECCEHPVRLGKCMKQQLAAEIHVGRVEPRFNHTVCCCSTCGNRFSITFLNWELGPRESWWLAQG